MKNKDRVIDVNITINADAIRAAASNAAKVQEIALEVPVVDPKDLSIDDQIFGLELLPVNDKAKKGPETAMYTAIKPIVVDVLSGRNKPGFITVNGTIDIPKEGGRINTIENCFFTKECDARAVCRIVTEVELDRSLERIENEQKNADFLKKQLEDDRF